jgi:hypothetical protein
MQCLATKDDNLAFQATKALCHLEPTDPAVLVATIKAVMDNPWFVRSVKTIEGPPRFHSYRAVALSLLGKDALPILHEYAKQAVKDKDFYGVANPASAAFVIDSKSAADFLPLLSAALGQKPTEWPRKCLYLTEEDLKGTLNLYDPFGYGKKKPKEELEEERKPIRSDGLWESQTTTENQSKPGGEHHEMR